MVKLRRPDPKLPLTPDEAHIISRYPYRSLVGALMYVAIGTRPDISFAVSKLASFLDCYRTIHWRAAIRVLRYLKGTRTMELSLGGSNIHLSGFTDSDYANCPDTGRSIGGYCFTLGTGVISWASRKQKTVADSTTTAEYIAAHDASRELMWIRYLLEGLGIPCKDSTELLCDNNAAIILSEDQVYHVKAKHINVRCHYLRERVSEGDLVLRRVKSADNTADILTKPLDPMQFLKLRGYLGLT